MIGQVALWANCTPSHAVFLSAGFSRSALIPFLLSSLQPTFSWHLAFWSTTSNNHHEFSWLLSCTLISMIGTIARLPFDLYRQFLRVITCRPCPGASRFRIPSNLTCQMRLSCLLLQRCIRYCKIRFCYDATKGLRPLSRLNLERKVHMRAALVYRWCW